MAQSEATLDVISRSKGITITTSTSQPPHASTNIPICPLNVRMHEAAKSKDKKDVCGLGTSRGNGCNISKGRMLHIWIGPIIITINFISPSYPPYAMIMHIVEPTTIQSSAAPGTEAKIVMKMVGIAMPFSFSLEPETTTQVPVMVFVFVWSAWSD